MDRCHTDCQGRLRFLPLGVKDEGSGNENVKRWKCGVVTRLDKVQNDYMREEALGVAGIAGMMK